MQFFVAMTIGRRVLTMMRDGATRVHNHNQVTRIPAFNLRDANAMCELLSNELPQGDGVFQSDTEMVRSFEVEVRLYGSKGSFYLSLSDLEMIATNANDILSAQTYGKAKVAAE